MQLKIKRLLANTIFMFVKLSYLQPGPLKRCDSPLSDVSMYVLIQVEDILRIFCEL
jgi:hypothetical protein